MNILLYILTLLSLQNPCQRLSKSMAFIRCRTLLKIHNPSVLYYYKHHAKLYKTRNFFSNRIKFYFVPTLVGRLESTLLLPCQTPALCAVLPAFKKSSYFKVDFSYHYYYLFYITTNSVPQINKKAINSQKIESMAFNIKWLFETLFYIENGYIYNVPTFEKF